MKIPESLSKKLRRVFRPAAGIGIVLLFAGCQSYLAFGTATKFGLDISQRPDQKVELTMGYRRMEMASIPVAAKAKDLTDAGETNDAYSVLARFRVKYDPVLIGDGEGLHLRQFFATGMAARKAAATPDMQKAFGQAAFEVKEASK